MAHEIGHNFGALHDGDGYNDCTKPWTKGIMGFDASMCYKHGNFSECSLKSMTRRLNDIWKETLDGYRYLRWKYPSNLSKDQLGKPSILRNIPYGKLFIDRKIQKTKDLSQNFSTSHKLQNYD